MTAPHAAVFAQIITDLGKAHQHSRWKGVKSELRIRADGIMLIDR